MRYGPGTEELALRIDNLVQLLARVEEMLQRYRSLRCRDDVNVFALGPSSGMSSELSQ
jgi:hypothetical protein